MVWIPCNWMQIDPTKFESRPGNDPEHLSNCQLKEQLSFQLPCSLWEVRKNQYWMLCNMLVFVCVFLFVFLFVFVRHTMCTTTDFVCSLNWPKLSVVTHTLVFVFSFAFVFVFVQHTMCTNLNWPKLSVVTHSWTIDCGVWPWGTSSVTELLDNFSW